MEHGQVTIVNEKYDAGGVGIRNLVSLIVRPTRRTERVSTVRNDNGHIGGVGLGDSAAALVVSEETNVGGVGARISTVFLRIVRSCDVRPIVSWLFTSQPDIREWVRVERVSWYEGQRYEPDHTRFFQGRTW